MLVLPVSASLLEDERNLSNSAWHTCVFTIAGCCSEHNTPSIDIMLLCVCNRASAVTDSSFECRCWSMVVKHSSVEESTNVRACCSFLTSESITDVT